MNVFDQLMLWIRHTRLTATLMAISIIVSILSEFGSDFQLLYFLFISEYSEGLNEIFNGQLWRLITPIVIHFGILHIVFNMLWLYQLGSAIEQHQGIKRMAILVIIISITSNISQYIWNGPAFGGMSGVVYGLLSYIWIQGKYNPRSGLGLEQNIAIMMLVWFVICWLGLVGNIANMAHTAGLISGVVIGYLYSPKNFKRKQFL